MAAVEQNFSNCFQAYMEELLSPKLVGESDIGVARLIQEHTSAKPMGAVQMEDFNLLRHEMAKFDPSVINHFAESRDFDTSRSMAVKRPKPVNGILEPAVLGSKEKPTKRATSNLRKLQNKLSQQRFRQRKRHAEAEQQNELDRMLSKIEALESAKTELPKLKSENVKLQSSLEVKDKEIGLLKKEIALAKKKKQESINEIEQASGHQKNIDNACESKEYCHMVSTLKEICAAYEDGWPPDEDMDAQRRIAPVLASFIDMAFQQTATPNMKSLFNLSLSQRREVTMVNSGDRLRVQDVFKSLNLSTGQEMKIMAKRASFVKELEVIIRTRKELNKAIQQKFASSQSSEQLISNMPSGFTTDIDQLKENIMCECNLRQNFHVMLFRLLNPIQIMKLILGSEPNFPDFVLFADVVAQDGDERGFSKS